MPTIFEDATSYMNGTSLRDSQEPRKAHPNDISKSKCVPGQACRIQNGQEKRLGRRSTARHAHYSLQPAGAHKRRYMALEVDRVSQRDTKRQICVDNARFSSCSRFWLDSTAEILVCRDMYTSLCSREPPLVRTRADIFGKLG